MLVVKPPFSCYDSGRKAVFLMDLCSPVEMRALLSRHGFHFSKAKGQNFLTQHWVVEQLAEGAGVGPDCGVLEIGPGMGPLTVELCQRAGAVVAVEVDTSLKPVLAETTADCTGLTILWADALKLDLRKTVDEQLPNLRHLACANLPYYITSPVLSALLEANCFESVTVMVQKEVAQRICAKPGTKDYGAFTVFCRYYADAELLFEVPASCFLPQPKVTSAVVKLTVRGTPPAHVENEACFFRTMRAAFAQRRKTLLNALTSGFPELGKPRLEDILLQAGISPTVRGETLDISEFCRISNLIASEGCSRHV